MSETIFKQYQEDEIDLRELWKAIVKQKVLIVVFTSIVTIVALIWVTTKISIYEVKSTLQIGFIGENLIEDPSSLIKTANLVFNVENKTPRKEDFISEVTSILVSKKLNNFVEIKTQGISNAEGLIKNKEVVAYIQNKYQGFIDQYILNSNNEVKNVQIQISNLENLEIKSTQRQIELLESQKIIEIDEKIKFYKKIKLKSLKEKIQLHSTKIDQYTKSVNKLYKNNNKITNSTVQAISSLQMVNYQNLILNSQNNVENLKIEIEKISHETIKNLQKEKSNLQHDALRKLIYKLEVLLPQKKAKLYNKINRLKFNNSELNIQNSKVIGNYIIDDDPVEPKKGLIIAVAFVIGLMLSIFLALFLNFIKKTNYESNSVVTKKV
jgi:uncharacterized protein involved in exopolysaccharide biosynthesis